MVQDGRKVKRRLTLVPLAVSVMLTLTACPLPPTNAICHNTGQLEKRGGEMWRCMEVLSEVKDGKPVSRWFKLHTPPAVVPSGR